jgi:SulP family sulfate permease
MIKILNNPEKAIVDFNDSRLEDMSSIEALNKITERYHNQGKKIHLIQFYFYIGMCYANK